jgi:hypothetical protein
VVHTGFVASEHYGSEAPNLLEHLDWVDCRQHGKRPGILMLVFPHAYLISFCVKMGMQILSFSG